MRDTPHVHVHVCPSPCGTGKHESSVLEDQVGGLGHEEESNATSTSHVSGTCQQQHQQQQQQHLRQQRPPLPLHAMCLASMSTSAADNTSNGNGSNNKDNSNNKNNKASSGGQDQPFLMSDIVIRTKNNERVDPEVLNEARAVLRIRPGFTYVGQDVEDDVSRVFSTGHFNRVSPELESTQDGLRLTINVEPNAPVSRIALAGCRNLPTNVIEEALSKVGYEFGKPLNYSRTTGLIRELNQYYETKGMFGNTVQVDHDPQTGVVNLYQQEVDIGRISVRLVKPSPPEDAAKDVKDDKKKDDKAVDKPKRKSPWRFLKWLSGNTKEEIVFREAPRKSGQAYSLHGVRRDIEQMMATGLFNDVNLLPTPGDDDRTVDITYNVQEKKSTRTFTAGWGLTSQGPTSGGFPGLMGSGSLTEKNLFGLGQRVTTSVEVGQNDRVLAFNYLDPWILGDPHRTSRTINAQMTNLPLSSTHAKRSQESRDGDESAIEGVSEGREESQGASAQAQLRVKRAGAHWEYGRPITPDCYATAGLAWQSLAIQDEATGERIAEDAYGCPLTLTPKGRDQSVHLQSRITYMRRPAHDTILVSEPEKSTTPSSDLVVRALRSMLGPNEMAVNIEQALPVSLATTQLQRLKPASGAGSSIVPADGGDEPEKLLLYTRVKANVRKTIPLVPSAGIRVDLYGKCGHTHGDLSPTEAYPVGGGLSVRGYDEGGVATARTFASGTAELSFPLLQSPGLEGVLFVDAGTDCGSSRLVPGTPGIVRGKPGHAMGKGVAARIDSPLGQVTWSLAWNDSGKTRSHLNVGHRF